MASNRRTFLKQTTTAVAGLASVPLLSGRWLDSRLTADQILNNRAMFYPEDEVRVLALRALDVAKSAGATYADVRINQSRRIQMIAGIIHFMVGDETMEEVEPMVESVATIGIRVAIDGSWGFAGGSVLTPEKVEHIARLATSYARDGRPRHPRTSDFAPAPVVSNGRWETPIEIDPFSIPIGQIMQFYIDGLTEVRRVKDAEGGGMPNWMKSERIYASTDGSFISQRTFASNPLVGAWAPSKQDWRLRASANLEGPVGGYGYETAKKLDLKKDWPRIAEEAARRATIPFKPAEVGRYDLVLGAGATAGLLMPTADALELDRALGERANEDGTTFAMPPEDILGKFTLGSKLVTITGDRSRPRDYATVGWDEEGVKPEDFTLVREGTIVDYITTRGNAPALAEWYQKQGVPVRSHGCAGRTGRKQPLLQPPNLTLKPGTESVSVEDLIKNVKRGYYLEGASVYPDQQQINIQLAAQFSQEIINGKLGSRVIELGAQSSLTGFWKNVAAIGGANTTMSNAFPVDSPDLDHMTYISTNTVPALVREINVINTGKEA